jgi:predicted nucleotidyltransferase
MELVERHRAEIEAACKRFAVRRLEVFGSATGTYFEEHSSDVDFLVEFEGQAAPNLFDRYFGLSERLTEILGRKVDLVTLGALRNPYFIEAVNRTRRLLYASQSAQTA